MCDVGVCCNFLGMMGKGCLKLVIHGGKWAGPFEWPKINCKWVTGVIVILLITPLITGREPGLQL